jgi:hypothetical protein
MTSEYGQPQRERNAVADALRDQQSFNRSQVAWLMSRAMGWGYDLGYEAGQRDELVLATVAAEYAGRHPFSAHETVKSLNRRRYREECDAAARLPRPGDFRGCGAARQAAA